MVKVPPPRGNGDPPTAENTIGNLDKPEPEKKVPMNFWVPDVFHTDFKVTAAKRGKTMVDQLFEAYALLKEKEGC